MGNGIRLKLAFCVCGEREGDTLIWLSPIVLFAHKCLCYIGRWQYKTGVKGKRMMLLLVAPDALLASVKTTAQCAFLVWVVGTL